MVFNQHFNYLSIFGPQGPPQEPRCHVGCTYWISPWWGYHLTRLAIACHRAFSGCFKPIKVPKPPQHRRPWCFWIDPSTSHFPDWSSKKKLGLIRVHSLKGLWNMHILDHFGLGNPRITTVTERDRVGQWGRGRYTTGPFWGIRPPSDPIPNEAIKHVPCKPYMFAHAHISRLSTQNSERVADLPILPICEPWCCNIYQHLPNINHPVM